MAALGERDPGTGLVLPRRKALGMVMGAAAVAAGGAVLSACGGVAGTTSNKSLTIPGAVQTSGGSSLSSSTANPKSASTMVAATASGVNLVASGAHINGTADNFTYYFTQTSGPGTWSCKVKSQPQVSGDGGYALAGLVARADGTAGAPEIALLCTDAQGVILRWRDTAGGTMNQWPEPVAIGVKAPVWLQMSLAKGSDAIGVAYSMNGTSWSNEGIKRSMSFAQGTFLMGLAACAHAAGAYAVDEFTHLQGFGNKKFYYLEIAPSSSATSSTKKSGTSGTASKG